MNRYSLDKRHPLDMFTDKDASHISRFVPFRFAGHIVSYELAVDTQPFKANILHFTILVVANQHGKFTALADIGNVLEKDILDTTARSGTILLVVENAKVEELTTAKILDADILKTDSTHQVVVSHIDGETSLIVNLYLAMIQNIYILIDQILYHLVSRRVSVQPNHDGMCNVGPQYCPSHENVTATT